MKNIRIPLAIAMCAALGGITFAASAPVIVTPAQTHWIAGTGMEKGTYYAALFGNPMKSGPYVMRLKLPAGTVFGPHYHNETENVTVISGSLWVGLGDKMDKSKMRPLGAGTFVSVPPHVHHYAMAKTDTVIQIEGTGPETMMPVGKM